MSTTIGQPGSTEARADSGRGGRPVIVVGLDGSDGARHALVRAMAEATRRGAAVEVFSAVPVDFYWTDAYLLDPRRMDSVRTDTEARAQALVTEVRQDPTVAALPGSSEVPVHALVAAGAPAEHLVQRAAGADLLVVAAAAGTRSAAR